MNDLKEKKQPSMIKWVVIDPRFSFIDKIQFFGFYFAVLLLLFFIFWMGYKYIRGGTGVLPMLIFVVLAIPLTKYSRKFHRKFSISYFEFVGKPEMAAKYEMGTEFATTWSASSAKTFLKLFILEGIFCLAFLILVIVTFGTKYFWPAFLIFWFVVIFSVFRLISKWQQKTAKLVEEYNPEEKSLSRKIIQWQQKWGIFINILLAIITFLVILWIAGLSNGWW